MEQISSAANPAVKAAVKLRDSVRRRREQGLFFLEGARLCEDALGSGYSPECVFTTQAAAQRYPQAVQRLHTAAGVAYMVTGEIAAKLSDTKTPQGIFGVFKMLDKRPGENTIESIGSYIALERIQDPANLGAVCRTAEALGLNGAILCGCCDVYHPKAQRAAMGSLLRLPLVETEDLPDLLSQLRGTGTPVYAAVPDSGAAHVTQVDFARGGVVVIGNEGNGVTLQTAAACTGKVTIPMRGRAESLNANSAAAILMWEMMRGRSE